jgi:hypothetical protein
MNVRAIKQQGETQAVSEPFGSGYGYPHLISTIANMLLDQSTTASASSSPKIQENPGTFIPGFRGVGRNRNAGSFVSAADQSWLTMIRV